MDWKGMNLAAQMVDVMADSMAVYLAERLVAGRAEQTAGLTVVWRVAQLVDEMVALLVVHLVAQLVA